MTGLFNPVIRHVLTSLVVAVSAVAAAAQESKPNAAGGDSAAQTPTIQQLLDRLSKVERELEALKRKPGEIPADPKGQRILVMLETPYIGSIYYGSPTNTRFFAAKLLLVNLTPQAQTLNRDDIQLVADGQSFSVKNPEQQYQYHSFQLGQQAIQLRTLALPKQVALSPGAVASTWVFFPDLPAGNHVPKMTIKLKLGDQSPELDVTTSQRDLLALSSVRLGPAKCLALVTLSGTLNTISVGSLVEELDKLSADKASRIVVRWADNSAAPDPLLMNWLQNSANAVGRSQLGEMQFPSVPATIRELHLANLPNSNGANYSINNFGGNTPRIHKTEADAVLTALQSVYEMLPRDQVLEAVQTGQRLERAAAMAGGGGRLDTEHLPLLLKLADDSDPVLQIAALTALSHFGEPPAVEKLLAYVRKNVEPHSTTAIGALAGSRFAAAHDALLDVLKNEPPESQKKIVKVLARYPRPVWSEIIFQFVKDPRSGLNVEALQALVQVGHPQLVSVLEEALKGTDANLRTQSFSLLSSRADRQSEELAVSFTLDQLKSAPPTPEMLNLLNRVKDRRAVPLLLAKFNNTQNKGGVIQTLALIGDQDTATALVEKYPTLQSHEKGELLKALQKLNSPKYRELSRQALLTPDASLVNAAVQGLQEEGGPEVVKILIEALETAGNSTTWSYVCNALAMLATPPARAALIKARDSGNQEKRNFAMNALTLLRQRSPGYQYVAAGMAFARQQKHKEALEQFDMALKQDPELLEAYAERGNIYLQQEKSAEAAKDFAKAHALDPFNPQALTGVCVTLVLEGKYIEGVKKITDARGSIPNDNLFHYNAACVFGRAVEHLQKPAQKDVADREKLIQQYTSSALADLRKSIELGFEDFDWMKKDPDLKSLQEVDDFKKLADQTPGAATKKTVRKPRL
jgi:HEAT repeat protein